MRGRVTGLGRKVTSPGRPLRTARDEHAAATGRHHLVAVERERPDRTEAPSGAPPVGRPDRLRRILNHRHAVAIAGGEDGVPVSALAEQVHPDHGGREPATVCSVTQLLLEQLGVEVPARCLAVDEDRPGTDVRDGVRGGDKRQCRHDHLVVSSDAEQKQRQMQRGGATRERGGIGDSEKLRELAFEAVDVRTERSDPARIERLEEQRALERGDVRGREEELAHPRPDVASSGPRARRGISSATASTVASRRRPTGERSWSVRRSCAPVTVVTRAVALSRRSVKLSSA